MNVFFTRSERETTATQIREAIALLKAERAAAASPGEAQDLTFAIEELCDDLRDVERTAITVMFDDGFADTRDY